jgi:hypothetical protein
MSFTVRLRIGLGLWLCLGSGLRLGIGSVIKGQTVLGSRLDLGLETEIGVVLGLQLMVVLGLGYG